MKSILALLVAVSSSVIGAVLGRSRRPLGPLPVVWVIITSVVAAGLSEGITLLWVGPPPTPLQPLLSGLGLGLVAGFFSGKNPPKDQNRGNTR